MIYAKNIVPVISIFASGKYEDAVVIIPARQNKTAIHLSLKRNALISFILFCAFSDLKTDSIIITPTFFHYNYIGKSAFFNNNYKTLIIITKFLQILYFTFLMKYGKIVSGDIMILSVNNITKSFGEKQVLKGISFSAESGKAIGILGRNGAGKTTLIRIIMDVFGADSGEVTIDGMPIDKQKIRIGYLPEERGLYPKHKIMEQLLYFASLQGINKKTAISNADLLFKRLQIEEYKNRRLDTLSKGNQQKVQLIATLITDPDLIILDEPFSGLDPVNASLLKDLVKDLIENGKLVLFSSHQMNYIEEFCNDILILNGGKIVLGGAIKDIKRSYARNIIEIATENSVTVADFLKSSQSDFIKRIDINEDKVIVTLKDENFKDKLMETLSQFGNSIDGFAVKEPTLNEIFVSYTEGQI